MNRRDHANKRGKHRCQANRKVPFPEYDSHAVLNNSENRRKYDYGYHRVRKLGREYVVYLSSLNDNKVPRENQPAEKSYADNRADDSQHKLRNAVG